MATTSARMPMNQGGASFEAANAQAEAYRAANGLNDPLPIQYVNWITGIVTRFDFGHSLLLQPAGGRGRRRAPAAHHPAGADLPHPGVALRHHASASSPRPGSIAGSTPLLRFISFLGMTVPRFLLAIIILYLLVFQLNVQDSAASFRPSMAARPGRGASSSTSSSMSGRSSSSPPSAGSPTTCASCGPICSTCSTPNMSRPPAPRACRESAVIMRHAVPNALHPLVAYQGVVLPYMLTGEIEVAIVFGAADGRPGHRRLDGRRRRLGHRDLHAGAGGDADRRQHHRRHAARLLDPRIRLGGGQ